jgi:hypothetical protein
LASCTVAHARDQPALRQLAKGNPATSRVVRTVYEVCLFRALRERLRCKEIWVDGADRWRNPDQDLPTDFDTRRSHYYAELSRPLDSEQFIGPLRQEMTAELVALQRELPSLDWLAISERRGGQITLSPLPADLDEQEHILACLEDARRVGAPYHSHG